jgi:hypothetical protein
MSTNVSGSATRPIGDGSTNVLSLRSPSKDNPAALLEPPGSGVRGAHQGAIMTTVTAMMVGALLAWAPSLLVFAWIMRDIRNTRGK